MTQHTPINYKNEYHKLLEENQSLLKQVGDLHALKEISESFFRDQLYSRGCAIGFLAVMLFGVSVALLLEVGYDLLF